MPEQIPKLNETALLLVLLSLKELLESIDLKIKSCGACADPSSKLSSKVLSYFDNQTDEYKEASREIKELIEALKNA